MLFRDQSNAMYEMFAFDTACGTWTNMGVTLPNNRVRELTTTLGQLFSVRFVENDNYEINIVEVVDVDVAFGKCSIVTSIMETKRLRIVVVWRILRLRP